MVLNFYRLFYLIALKGGFCELYLNGRFIGRIDGSDRNGVFKIKIYGVKVIVVL